MEKKYLIVNIGAAAKSLVIQVNRKDAVGRCYNIFFNNADSYLILAGFTVPTLYTDRPMSIYGDRDLKTLQHCLKALPAIKEKNTDLLSFLACLIKTEKLNHCQININGNMDYERAEKIDMSTIAKIGMELAKVNIHVEF